MPELRYIAYDPKTRITKTYPWNLLHWTVCNPPGQPKGVLEDFCLMICFFTCVFQVNEAPLSISRWKMPLTKIIVWLIIYKHGFMTRSWDLINHIYSRFCHWQWGIYALVHCHRINPMYSVNSDRQQITKIHSKAGPVYKVLGMLGVSLENPTDKLYIVAVSLSCCGRKTCKKAMSRSSLGCNQCWMIRSSVFSGCLNTWNATRFLDFSS